VLATAKAALVFCSMSYTVNCTRLTLSASQMLPVRGSRYWLFGAQNIDLLFYRPDLMSLVSSCACLIAGRVCWISLEVRIGMLVYSALDNLKC
jgi:hypothetical protein